MTLNEITIVWSVNDSCSKPYTCVSMPLNTLCTSFLLLIQVNGEKLCSDNSSKLEQLVDGEVVSITLFTNTAALETGFMMTFSQG